MMCIYCCELVPSVCFISLHLELYIFQCCFILMLVATEHTCFCAFGTIHLLTTAYISCSGSTIVGIGSPDPPAFVYDDEDYQDVFVSGMLRVFYYTPFQFLCSQDELMVELPNTQYKLNCLECSCDPNKLEVWNRHSEGLISFCAEACLLTRDENEWYREPISSNATSSKEGLQASVAD